MSVKIRFDLRGMLEPYTFVEQGSKPDEWFNLATGKPVTLKAGDEVKAVDLNFLVPERREGTMLFRRNEPMGSAEYGRFLAGILTVRER